jgi:hypothetical protein
MLATMGTAGAMHGWAIATAAVVAAGCALVGTLLVVRRLSLLGDAVSHAVLPGLAIAVLAGGRPGGVLVFVGAVTAAVVTVWGARALGTAGGLDEDSGAGVVFTTMFALGVVLVTAFARGMHLDPQCLLYGDLEYVPFDTVAVAGVDVPRAFVGGAVVLGVEYDLAACLAPQDGFVARLRARIGLAWRIACEDMLAGLWRAEESGAADAAAPTGSGVPPPARLRIGLLATARLRIGGLIERHGTQWRLTPRGRREAEMIVRSHRLWEAWLGRHADLPVDHLHPPAEWVEHHLGSGLRHRIEEELGRGVGDPHGRDIPPES